MDSTPAVSAYIVPRSVARGTMHRLLTDQLERHQPSIKSMSPTFEHRLPTECIVLVAQFLAGSFQFGALAHLARASRKIHLETESVLFETLLWDTEEKSWILHGGRIPRGWKHVR